MSRPSMSRGQELTRKTGAGFDVAEGRRPAVRYSHAHDGKAAELGYEHNWDYLDGEDTEAARAAALRELMADLISELTETQALCLEYYVINGGYPLTGPKTAWRAVAALIGDNPATGKPIDEKTVKRNVHKALAKLRARLLALPAWQAELLELPDRPQLAGQKPAPSEFLARFLRAS